jgi:hypothetical protein
MAAYIILLLAMSYLSSKLSTQFKGIDSEMVVDLPSNITFNLKLCTLSSVRKVAFNNMVLGVVISNVGPTHELPLLCIASILTICSCSKLTREPVGKESDTGPIIDFIIFCFSLGMLIIFDELLVVISRQLRMPQ